MDWKEYYINIAKAVALKSKDNSTKVGCIIVDKDNRVVSQGFNGFVKGCDESLMTLERPLKYSLIIHAEANALLFARRDLKDCNAFVTHAPCSNCLKHLLQAGIRYIFYEDASVTLRASVDEMEAIHRLIGATNAVVENINGKTYLEELYANRR